MIKLGSLCANRERDSEQRDENMFTYKRTASFEVSTTGLLSARDKTCMYTVCSVLFDSEGIEGFLQN